MTLIQCQLRRTAWHNATTRAKELKKKIWPADQNNKVNQDQPETLGSILGSMNAHQNDKSVPFEIGDSVYWYRQHKDIPGRVTAVRDGKVLVHLLSGGAWAGTSRWISPTELRKYDQQWNPTM